MEWDSFNWLQRQVLCYVHFTTIRKTKFPYSGAAPCLGGFSASALRRAQDRAVWGAVPGMWGARQHPGLQPPEANQNVSQDCHVSLRADSAPGENLQSRRIWNRLAMRRVRRVPWEVPTGSRCADPARRGAGASSLQ